MTIDDVLDDFIDWYEAQLKEYKDIRTDAKLALLEIIKKEKPEIEKYDSLMSENVYSYYEAGKTDGFNQGVEAYEKKIEDLFK